MAFRQTQSPAAALKFPAAPKMPKIPAAGNTWGRRLSAPYKKPFGA